MIRYALRCLNGHAFESWFVDAAAFDSLAARSLVTCPACDSHDVEKAIMAPAIVARRASPPASPSEPKASAPPEVPSDIQVPALPPQERHTLALVDERRQMVRALHEKIVAETRDVGTSFADEARRIHAGDTQERIRGQASLEEARDLIEEGIMVLPLPIPPDDLN